MPIRCEIVSQDRTVFQGLADMVVLPGTDGEMGILPHHAPLLTTLKYGIIKVRSHGVETFYTVAGGIAEIQPDIITVLADAAENVEEINNKVTELKLDFFLKRFENGLYTMIGEDGRALSGGELQILGLIRALYNLPDILNAFANETITNAANGIYKNPISVKPIPLTNTKLYPNCE